MSALTLGTKKTTHLSRCGHTPGRPCCSAAKERTCASGDPASEPGRGAALLGLSADELHCSRSDRSSLDVVLEQVSSPLSVAVGLEMDEAALSEAGRLEVGKPCSMKGTPPDGQKQSFKLRKVLRNPPMLLPDRLLLLRVLDAAASI